MEPGIYRQSYNLEKEHWWYSARRSIILYFFKLYKGESPEARLLDAGCGTGYTLSQLSRYGDAFGIDLSGDAVELSQKRNLRRLQFASIDKLPFKNNAFDWIFSLDTIEHLENDIEALKEFNRVCKTGGYIFLCVPAHRFLWSGEDVVSQHKRRYTQRSLIALVGETNLKIVKLTHFNFLLFPMVLLVILKKNAFRQQDSNIQKLPRGLNSILRLIFELEKFILRRFNMPFGVSIMCIAQKK